MSDAGKKPAAHPIVFGEREWAEEVERYAPSAVPRLRAETARREIEAGRSDLVRRPCETPGPDKTILPGCRKLYIPLGEEGASAAPFGFVLQAVRTNEGLAWGFLAFGERHPDNPATRSVYQRAHHRLHGRYP
jgi:hypothetical protein